MTEGSQFLKFLKLLESAVVTALITCDFSCLAVRRVPLIGGNFQILNWLAAV